MIEREELIARIEARAAEWRQHLREANGFMKALRGDISRTMAKRLEDNGELPLWTPEELEEAAAA